MNSWDHAWAGSRTIEATTHPVHGGTGFRLSVVQQVAIIYTGTRSSLLGNVGDLTAFMVAGQGPLFGRMRAVKPYPEIAWAIDLVGR